MKKLISLLLFLSITAFAADVRWTFTDFTSSPHSVKKIYITPIAAYGTNSTNIITGDRRTYTNNSLGSLIVSNVIVGRSYRVELHGPFTETVITNSFDSGVSGFVEAVNYIAAPLSDGGLTSYSKTAADARFHNVSGDTSTNAAFRGTFKIPAGATVGYVLTVTNADGSSAWSPGSGGVATANTSNAYNLTFVIDRRYTNDTPHYAQISSSMTFTQASSDFASLLFAVDTNIDGTSDFRRTNYFHVNTGTTWAKSTVTEIVPPGAAYGFTNISTGASTVALDVGSGAVMYFFTNYASGGSSSTSGALTNNDTRGITFLNGLTVQNNLEVSSISSGAGNLSLSPEASGNVVISVGQLVGNGGGLTNLTGAGSSIAAGTNIVTVTNGALVTVHGTANVTQAGLAAGSYAINGMLVDGDAALYLTAVGKTNSQFAARADGGFKALKDFNLWTNLIDGAVLGTNLNLSGSYWRTLKLNYGTNVNNPSVLDYGLQFHGTNRAYIRNLSDMRTNTILVCYQSIGNFDATSTNAIFAAQNTSSSNGSVAVFAYPYVGPPAYAAHPLHHYVGQNISGGEATSNSFTAFTGASVSARHMDEFYVSIGVSNGVRTATINGYGAALTNTAFSLSSGITSFNLGAFLAGDSGADTSGMFKGKVMSFLIFNQMLTTNEVRKAMTALRWFDVREENVIFIGDSLSNAYDDPYESGTYATNNWPWLWMNNSANSNRFFYRNWGRGGLSIGQHDAADYTNKVHAFRPGGPVKRTRLMYWLGANDVLQNAGSASWASPLALAIQSWDLANKNGFQVEVLNIPTMTNSFGGQVTNNTFRLGLNRSFETNSGFYSKLWDIDALVPFRNTNSTYSVDGTHGTYAYHKVIADYLTGGQISSTGALYRTRGSIIADAFVGDGTMLNIGEDVAFMRDDFFSGIATTANGDLNWATTGTVTTRNTVYDTGSWGVLSLQSAATSGTAGQIYLSASGGGYLGTLPLATVVPWRAKFIIRPTNTNAVANVAGFAVPSSVWGATTHGIYVRADDTMDGGNWKFITRGSGGATTNDTGVVARTNSFVKFEFQGVTVGSVMLRVDGGAWITNSTTMPDAVSPIVSIVPRENVAKTNAIDFFEFVAWPDR